MSPEGRRRLAGRVLRAAAAALALAAVSWGAWRVAGALRAGAVADEGVPIGPPRLTTDGVLDQAWLVRTLDLPARATLMSLDLDGLRARLLADGQVEAATLIRDFPATLAVHLSERTPVARLEAQDGGGAPRQYLVARDGVVYRGSGYQPGLIASLPWLAGIRLESQGGALAPIPDMDVVADLLAKARLDAEPLYRTWRVVSLAHLRSDGEITVQTRDGIKVVFGTGESFDRQLAKLYVVLATAKAPGGSGRVSEVDLSLGPQVPVAFAAPAPPPARPFSLPSSSPREF
jgi:cell division septal protein FtsQ